MDFTKMIMFEIPLIKHCLTETSPVDWNPVAGSWGHELRPASQPHLPGPGTKT